MKTFRACITCSATLPTSSFYVKVYKRKGGTAKTLSGACKRCIIQRSNANASYENSAGRRARNRQLINEKKAAPCLDCGQRFPAVCMDFDHRDRAAKTRGVTAMVQQAEETLLKEIEKCDLVCANCHRIRTAKQLGWKYSTIDLKTRP